MNNFEYHLKRKGLSQNTIDAYIYTVKYFKENYNLDLDSLLEYKGYLVENFKPKTVNLRIQALNNYLKFIDKSELCLQALKIQQKTFLEDVVSYSDYLFLKRKLRNDLNMKWHFVVWYLGATGARVGEIVKMKVEHVNEGYFDVYSKGGKIRRLYIPKKLKRATLIWLEDEQRTGGYLFLNKYGDAITPRGISQQLKFYADKYGLEKRVIYPHSFRHMYAKRFLEKFNDISLLADLLGHESIETTRIYLRRSSSEQQQIVDKIVTW
ncbi:MAG: tyrosine-type recombinase/integrase [Streptococcaceae bacterium]|nr:tyrosine-type recombinase/integrase [Streptococcaceae bacterium]